MLVDEPMYAGQVKKAYCHSCNTGTMQVAETRDGELFWWCKGIDKGED